jgi:hypothetical protein
MFRKISTALAVLVLGLLAAVPVFALPGMPDFGEHIYVDGVAWGTKATTPLPNPEGAEDSFDVLYVFLDKDGNPVPLADQLLVAEAAPGDTDYNGGRWEVFTVQWQISDPPELTSFEAVHAAEMAGGLTITEGSFSGGPPAYFSCPLLPVLH